MSYQHWPHDDQTIDSFAPLINQSINQSRYLPVNQTVQRDNMFDPAFQSIDDQAISLFDRSLDSPLPLAFDGPYQVFNSVPINQSNNQPNHQIINQPNYPLVDQSISSSNQPFLLDSMNSYHQSIFQPDQIGESSPTSHSSNQSVCETRSHSSNDSSSQLSNQSIGQSINQSTNQSIQSEHPDHTSHQIFYQPQMNQSGSHTTYQQLPLQHQSNHVYQAPNQYINQSVNQSAGQPMNQPITQAESHPSNAHMNHSTTQSMNQSLNQSPNQSISQSSGRSINRPVNPKPVPPPVAVATIVDADSTLTKQLRHREIDRRRRERENNVLARLKSLIDQSINQSSDQLSVCDTTDDKQSNKKSKKSIKQSNNQTNKSMDRVSLLEAACAHIEALHRQADNYQAIQSINRSINQSISHAMINQSIDRRVVPREIYYMAISADTGQQVDLQSIHLDEARIVDEAGQSMNWLLVSTHLEIAYAKQKQIMNQTSKQSNNQSVTQSNNQSNDAVPHFTCKVPENEHDFKASPNDPEMTHFMTQCWHLLQAGLTMSTNRSVNHSTNQSINQSTIQSTNQSINRSINQSVQVWVGDKNNQDEEDFCCTLWLARARYHGKPNSHNSLTNGRVIVIGSYVPC